ncbi:uncharacterized protein LOC103317629 [Nasonia vitripennis]|uniref:ZP domain-containing protein n=1 Tax=Nasonia vitripennis TaxID=7425 RepID=A0A7M7Q675_NASVI|nr:uncharacterized protein LOC103317629 [Nasonia vitripennis]
MRQFRSVPCLEVLLLVPLCLGVAIEPILLSYPSRRTAQRVYLPPESPGFALPEVIDNRARLPSVSSVDIEPARPALGLQTPFANQAADFYPVYAFTRGSAQELRQRNVAATENASNDVFGDLLPGQVQINDMSCQNSAEELYFRASLSPPKDSDHPVIENAGSGSCKIVKLKSEYRIDFGKDDFWNCGVVDCSADSGRYYCLSLRFPTISGLRLRDDLKMTLQCRAQERVASHTRRLHLKAIDTAARMAPRVAAGGHKSAFETDIALYRKSFGAGSAEQQVFDAKIESGGTLLLGEEILLRAAVREGDGWKYSKISEVTVHFVEKRQRKKIMNSLWILDSEGCLNPQVREICSGEQYRVSPLESYLLFKAFMFESMQESDEMVLSVKVIGCLSGEDCALNCPAGHSRKARDLGAQGRSGTHDWQNDITFRVVASLNRAEAASRWQTVGPYAGSVLVLGAIVALACLVEFYTRKRRPLRT